MTDGDKLEKSALPADLEVEESESEQGPLSDFVVSELRKAIFNGTLKPGHRLREAKVGNWLGVSRTPVREALRKLMEAGLLVFTPPRGMTVVTLSSHQVKELYAVRESLEGTAARLAAQFADPAEIMQMYAIVDRSEKEEDGIQLKYLNWRFHNVLYNAAHNTFLLKSLHGLADSIMLLPNSTFSVPGRKDEALHEHREIVGAIERHDQTMSEKLAKRHIRRALEYRLQQMSENQLSDDMFG